MLQSRAYSGVKTMLFQLKPLQMTFNYDTTFPNANKSFYNIAGAIE
jgi:hypothetical protein